MIWVHFCLKNFVVLVSVNVLLFFCLFEPSFIYYFWSCAVIGCELESLILFWIIINRKSLFFLFVPLRKVSLLFS